MAQSSAAYAGYASSTRVAGIGSRILAYLIDAVLIFAVAGGLILLGQLISDSMATLAAVVASVGPIVYFIVMEARDGATIGKRMLGLRVVSLDGSPISTGQSVIRNLLRIVDSLVAGLVGLIVMATNAEHQRVGDKVAKTLVVRD